MTLTTMVSVSLLFNPSVYHQNSVISLVKTSSSEPLDSRGSSAGISIKTGSSSAQIGMGNLHGKETVFKQVRRLYLKSWRSSAVDQAHRLTKQTGPYPSRSEAGYCDNRLKKHEHGHLPSAHQM